MQQLTKFRIACVVFALVLVAVVYAADTGICKPYFDFIRALPLGDKFSHFVLMGTMATLANLAFKCRTIGVSSVMPGIGTMVVAVIVVAEEISQIWIPGRSFDVFDLAADLLGIACGDLLARRLWSGAVAAEG